MAERFNHDELSDLLKALSDGTLSPEESERLDSILKEDAEARAFYLRYMNVDALLGWRLGPVPEVPLASDRESLENDKLRSAQVEMPSAERSNTSTKPGKKRRWLGGLAVCAMLAGVAVGVPIGWLLNESPERTATNGVPERDFVATLVSVSDDAVWKESHSAARLPGEGLDKGWLRLEAGVVEMRFACGARVQLEGPAAFGVDSPLRGFLEYGKVSVRAPEGARDFVIGTSSMEVVDLGTQFNLSINEETGEADVEVVEGLVDLHLNGEENSSQIQSLVAGRSAVISSEGEVVHLGGKALDPKHGDSTGLLAHWPMDDLDENRRVADASANELHGILNHNTAETSVAGKVGGALDLTKRGYVDLNEHVAALSASPAFTLTAWVRDASDIVFSMSDGTPLDRVQFELHNQWLYYGWQKGDRFDYVPARVSEWKANRWYHVAVSVSGGRVTIFRDGKALIAPRSHGRVIGTRVRAPIDVEQPTHAYLGFLVSNQSRRKQFLGGQIDDVQFYGRALDERAIRFLYEHPGETYTEGLTP